MLLRKQNRFVLAKKSWSQPTRATISRFLFGRTTFCWRNLNQVVAAGPKIAVEKCVLVYAVKGRLHEIGEI